jgi:four helix bundle protein
MRDHRKLDVFILADQLTLKVYEATRRFPDDERFGLTSQIRRAAVSVGANIVEGAARISDVDFARMLAISYGSACELEYELSLAVRLGYLSPTQREDLEELSSRTCRALRGLINRVRKGSNI